MKDYIADILQTISARNLAGRFGLETALIIPFLAFIVGYGKVLDLLQNNGFGFWGDALIVSLSYICIVLIAWTKLIFYYCLGSAAGLIIAAGVLAMTYGPVMLVGPLLIYAAYGVTRRPLPQPSFRLEFPLIISSRFSPNSHTSSGKLSSLAGGPYPLYFLSCIMLN